MIGVGIEGLWGIGFCACLIAIMNFVPDPRGPAVQTREGPQC